MQDTIRTPMQHRDSILELEKWLSQQIIGQEKLVNRLLIALLADGHLLVEGAPGLAKTKAIKELADVAQRQSAELRRPWHGAGAPGAQSTRSGSGGDAGAGLAAGNPAEWCPDPAGAPAFAQPPAPDG